jgi:ferric-dicitrate binding protein FerR (iron transport regulator)
MRHVTRLAATATLFLCLPLTAQIAGQIVAKASPAAIATLAPRPGLKAEEREAAIGMPFHWHDALVTEPGGRIRARLRDGSFVSLTQQTKLVIQKHDSRRQQTSLDLVYGTIRLQVVPLFKPDSSFEIRTNYCIVGALGQADFIVDASSPVSAIITVFSGTVSTSNSAPTSVGRVQLTAGQQWQCNEPEPTRLLPEQAERLKRQFPEKP